jgi:hypothetical protein
MRPRGLLGAATDAKPIYLNTHEPFCLVTVGVQGAGKSHTFCSVLENCLVPVDTAIRLVAPQAALVFHFDQCQDNICEATGLAAVRGEKGVSLDSRRMIVLVSPTYFRQRQEVYRGLGCEVVPLLFSWHSLTAKQIKALMRIDESESQLYIALLLDKLRRYQRDGYLPHFDDFLQEIEEACPLQAQSGPLKQRLTLLETMVAESEFNRDFFAGVATRRPETLFAQGTMVVCDLTDPLMSSMDANAIFQVLLEQFRTADTGGCGKVLAMDEAHKFMDGTAGGRDGLSRAIIDAARLMRHDGMRLVISTQSPKALAPELLELVSVAVVHRFHSHDWFSYLSSKIPLAPGHFREIRDLEPGEALLFTPLHRLENVEGDVFKLRVRERFTSDRGASRLNVITHEVVPSPIRPPPPKPQTTSGKMQRASAPPQKAQPQKAFAQPQPPSFQPQSLQPSPQPQPQPSVKPQPRPQPLSLLPQVQQYLYTAAPPVPSRGPDHRNEDVVIECLRQHGGWIERSVLGTMVKQHNVTGLRALLSPLIQTGVVITMDDLPDSMVCLAEFVINSW